MSQLSQIFKDIADAIRSKTGSTDTLTPPQMANAINNIPSGGGTLYLWYNTNEEPTVILPVGTFNEITLGMKGVGTSEMTGFFFEGTIQEVPEQEVLTYCLENTQHGYLSGGDITSESIVTPFPSLT